jgi:hypothetical protein
MVAPVPAGYPVSLTVDAAEGDRNRVTCAFRLFYAIPILILAGTVGGGTYALAGNDTRTTVSAAGGLLVGGPALMILFREKYPRWWFDWNVSLLRFLNRVGVYLFMLRDEYPSTDEEQAVHLEVPYPEVKADLNRWLPLVKWFLAIPHYIVLVFLGLGVFFALIVAWFALLITGRYPPGIRDFVVGVMRWHNRVTAYAFILVTDQYPPFRLAP